MSALQRPADRSTPPMIQSEGEEKKKDFEM